ncbi:MAG: HRDC domain-containing protein [Microbacteriaceae bacterium]|jgi:ribonuclease D|nr:HRDC domain-containing protein [Microbacteriaceae bacterium]MCI1207261.1 HRDC domain-containing protein [Microbacteriaceae bacterium]
MSEQHTVVEVTEPPEGLPPLIDTDEGLAEVAASLAAGTGPVAIDTERAGSYRYSDRAYLVQLHREGSGSFLIDPLPFGTLPNIQAAINGVPWIFHAVLADLPACRDLGLEPTSVFDTELAARLLNLPNVGLGGVVEDLLGIHLKKAHSAANWSRRPIPVDWIRYATLDVEYLIPLRALMLDALEKQGKTDIAHEEFAALLTNPAGYTRPPDWTHLHGLTGLHQNAQRHVAQALWTLRNEIARAKDLSPHRIYPDRAIIQAARQRPRSRIRLAAILGTRPDGALAAQAWEIFRAASEDGTPLEVPRPLFPQTKVWSHARPLADARLRLARRDLAVLAAHEDMPAENLLEPHVLKAVCWEPPSTLTAPEVAESLRAAGAREWQVTRTAAALSVSFTQAELATANA